VPDLSREAPRRLAGGDPAGAASLDEAQRIRDDIDARVRHLPGEFGVPAT